MTDAFAALKDRPRRRQRVVLAWDAADAERLTELRQEADRLQGLADGPFSTDARVDAADAAQTALAEAEKTMAVVVWEFESIGTRAVDNLIAKYPASEDQNRDHKAQGGKGRLAYDPVRFGRALVAAACTKVTLPDGGTVQGLTVDQVTDLFDSGAYSAGDQQTLQAAAQLVDMGRSVIDDHLKRLSRDPLFAAELGYCVPLGIPHSTWLDWDDDDRAKALAFRRWDSARCSGCGTFPDEWLDDDGRALPDPPWVAEFYGCEGCRELDRARTETGDDKDPGLHVHLVTPPDPDDDI